MHRCLHAVTLVAIVAVLPALGGCISRHTMSLTAFKARPEQQMGKTLQFTLANGKQDSMVLEGVRSSHAYGQSRGYVKHVNLNDVVAVKEERISTGAIVGTVLGVVALAVVAAVVAGVASDGFGIMR